MDLLHINIFSHYQDHDVLNQVMQLHLIRNLKSIWILIFYVFYCNIIKVNHFIIITTTTTTTTIIIIIIITFIHIMNVVF